MAGEWEQADITYMEAALVEARNAFEHHEVPVGAVLVAGGEVVARAHNLCVTNNDPTAHAEVIALRAGGEKLKNYRLNDATLYVTLEPCTMCVGALGNARVSRVVFAAYDEKEGALGSAVDLSGRPGLNYRIEINGGLLADKSTALLQAFFETRRA